MFRSARMLATGIAIWLAVSIVVGCSTGNPSSPSGSVGCLYIGGDYLRLTGDPAQGFSEGAHIAIRHGSRTGRVASGLEVDINGHVLAFAQSVGEYVGAVPGLAMGDTLRICVSEGADSVDQTIQVPHAPSSLQLEGGSWDISGLSSVNRLSWDIPAELGQAVVVRLYDYDGLSSQLLLEIASGEPGYSSLTIPNSVLPYYETLAGVGAVVSQVDYAEFLGNPDDSMVAVHAGIMGTWPVSSRD